VGINMRDPIDVFGDWAEKGKDRGMEKTMQYLWMK
tara:strand:- start:222 stop:326 length:105 start_codon:yes stop_codon:yes gene_type:complete